MSSNLPNLFSHLQLTLLHRCYCVAIIQSDAHPSSSDHEADFSCIPPKGQPWAWCGWTPGCSRNRLFAFWRRDSGGVDQLGYHGVTVTEQGLCRRWWEWIAALRSITETNGTRHSIVGVIRKRTNAVCSSVSANAEPVRWGERLTRGYVTSNGEILLCYDLKTSETGAASLEPIYGWVWGSVDCGTPMLPRSRPYPLQAVPQVPRH